MGGVYNLSGAGLLAVTGTTYLGSGIGVGEHLRKPVGPVPSPCWPAGDSIAYNSKGTCNLEGGLMVVNGVAVGSGTGTFNFTGGTLQAGAATTNFGIPLNGAATIDTNGHTMAMQNLVTTTGVTDLNFDLSSPGGSAPLVIGSQGLIVNPNTAISFGTDPKLLGDYPLIGGTMTRAAALRGLRSGHISSLEQETERTEA